MAKDPGTPHELLSGSVERVTFHNPESGFAVLRVHVSTHRDLVTVVGHIATVTPGEHVQASGTWERDRTHGLQFKALYLHTAAPGTREGMSRYLGSGLVRGIGPQLAERLLAAFGTEVFDVIEQTPARLRDVPGIGQVRAERIAEAWRAQRVVRDIMVFLHSHGVGTSRAVRIYKTYGADAIGVIKENPYRLARDIRGIGFVSADRIASSLGIEPHSMIRVRAGVGWVLAQALDAGHCGLPRADLVESAARQLTVDAGRVHQAIDLEVQDGYVVIDRVEDRDVVFLAALHAAESTIATRLRALRHGPPPWPAIDAAKALPWVEDRLGVVLADGQRAALRQALVSKLLVVTGGPGVGKTTLLNAILRILTVKGVRPVLAAPTGRAAKRMSEATGLEAKTIHRLLEIDPRHGRFRRDEQNPIDADLIVVDESSMVDVLLMAALVRAIPRQAALLLVGDADQLPSVGPGQVLADVIASGACPIAALTTVFRQAEASWIVRAAHRINQGLMPQWSDHPDADCRFVEATDPADAEQKILQLVVDGIPRRFALEPRDVQVLCPMNRGTVGARALNLSLQQRVNPNPGPKVERFGWVFTVGDKVMQTENNYDKDVYNGDLGLVRDVDLDQGTVSVEFDGRTVVYAFGELDELVLAYATTVHKAQGSEYPAVVLPLSTQHYPMLQRNLLYTGVTRGRRLVVLVGERRALEIAVRGRGTRRRWSKLKDRLTDAEAPGIPG